LEEIGRKVGKKLDVWQGNSLSMDGRSTLIKASMSNATIYHMLIFLLPKTTIQGMEKIRRSFFWQGGRLKKKYHLVKWEKVCRAKKYGGLCFKDLRWMNVSLLCKWWWLLETGKGLWQDIVRLKYVKNFPICDIPLRMQDSPLWKDQMKVRGIYLRGRGLNLNNGSLINFWKDVWLGDNPLCLTYPVLFDLCMEQNCSIFVVAQKGWVLGFKVRLHGVVRDQWYCLVAALNNVILTGEVDASIWKWSPKKKFTVKLVYDYLSRDVVRPQFREIWSSRFPEKIKIFMWLLEQKAILTKDNMIKRKWQGAPGCYFCQPLKTVII
jgi:hypothetical protein